MAEQNLPSPSVPFVKDNRLVADVWFQCISLMWSAFNRLRTDATEAAEALSDDIDDGIDDRLATQAELETATDVEKLVTPGRVQFHPGTCKAWGQFNFAGAVAASHNITSITDTAPGRITVTIATDFSGTSWAAQALPGDGGVGSFATNLASTKTAGSLEIRSWAVIDTPPASAALADTASMDFSAFGDQ